MSITAADVRRCFDYDQETGAFSDIADGLVIDHIDGNGLNNRLTNLRVVTKSTNQRNRRDVRASLRGVYEHRGGFVVYTASVYTGWTKDYFEACCMRKSAEVRLGYIVETAS